MIILTAQLKCLSKQNKPFFVRYHLGDFLAKLMVENLISLEADEAEIQLIYRVLPELKVDDKESNCWYGKTAKKILKHISFDSKIGIRKLR